MCKSFCINPGERVVEEGKNEKYIFLHTVGLSLFHSYFFHSIGYSFDIQIFNIIKFSFAEN